MPCTQVNSAVENLLQQGCSAVPHQSRRAAVGGAAIRRRRRRPREIPGARRERGGAGFEALRRRANVRARRRTYERGPASLRPGLANVGEARQTSETVVECRSDARERLRAARGYATTTTGGSGVAVEHSSPSSNVRAPPPDARGRSPEAGVAPPDVRRARRTLARRRRTFAAPFECLGRSPRVSTQASDAVGRPRRRPRGSSNIREPSSDPPERPVGGLERRSGVGKSVPTFEVRLAAFESASQALGSAVNVCRRRRMFEGAGKHSQGPANVCRRRRMFAGGARVYGLRAGCSGSLFARSQSSARSRGPSLTFEKTAPHPEPPPLHRRASRRVRCPLLYMLKRRGAYAARAPTSPRAMPHPSQLLDTAARPRAHEPRLPASPPAPSRLPPSPRVSPPAPAFDPGSSTTPPPPPPRRARR